MIRWGDPVLSELLAGAFMALLTLVWATLCLTAGKYGERARLTPAEPAPPRWPSLSVCIPARDEEGRVGEAVRLALASDYPDLEVVVVDDRSHDKTGEEARAAAAGDPRFRLVMGTEPPAGWAGKPWACLRAAGESRGELLLFLDADVEIAPWTARAAVARLLNGQHQLLSVFGDWRLVTFWERAVIPVVGWFIRGAVNLDAVNEPGRPEAFANGQLILTTRAAYDAVGGHEAVRAEVLDDVRLARAFKRRVLSTVMLYAPGSFTVRLYRNLGEIVRGYGKNLYEGMDRRPLLGVGAMLFILVSTLGPYALFLTLAITPIWPGWALAGPGWTLWAAVIVGLIHLFRYRVERADGRSGWHSLTHPLGNVIFLFILARSIFGVEADWKGRRFVDGRAA